jgi:hypothetical protein
MLSFLKRWQLHPSGIGGEGPSLVGANDLSTVMSRTVQA